MGPSTSSSGTNGIANPDLETGPIVRIEDEVQLKEEDHPVQNTVHSPNEDLDGSVASTTVNQSSQQPQPDLENGRYWHTHTMYRASKNPPSITINVFPPRG